MITAAFCIPADLRETANEAAYDLGLGPDTFAVPLSAEGDEPATHYGCNFAAIEQETIDTILAAIPGVLTAPSWAELLESNELVRVEPQE